MSKRCINASHAKETGSASYFPIKSKIFESAPVYCQIDGKDEDNFYVFLLSNDIIVNAPINIKKGQIAYLQLVQDDVGKHGIMELGTKTNLVTSEVVSIIYESGDLYRIIFTSPQDFSSLKIIAPFRSELYIKTDYPNTHNGNGFLVMEYDKTASANWIIFKNPHAHGGMYASTATIDVMNNPFFFQNGEIPIIDPRPNTATFFRIMTADGVGFLVVNLTSFRRTGSDEVKEAWLNSEFDDFIGSSESKLDWTIRSQYGGTGGVTTNQLWCNENHIGVVYNRTSTSSSDNNSSSYFYLPDDGITLGNSYMFFEWMVTVDELASANSPHDVYIGLSNNTRPHTATQYVRFHINGNVNDNIICEVSNGTNTATFDTGVVFNASDWHKLRILVSSKYNAIFFYVGEIVVWTCTDTTAFPTDQTSVQFGINKIVGDTNRIYLYTDYFNFKYAMNAR